MKGKEGGQSTLRGMRGKKERDGSERDTGEREAKWRGDATSGVLKEKYFALSKAASRI